MDDMNRYLDHREQVQKEQEALDEVRKVQEPLKEIRKAQRSRQGIREAQEVIQQVREAQEPLREVQKALRRVREMQQIAKEAQPSTEVQKVLKQVREAQETLKQVRAPVQEARAALQTTREVREALQQAREARKAVEALRAAYLGRSAGLTKAKKSISQLPVERRKEVGSELNRASRDFQEAVNDRVNELKAIEREAQLRAEAVDVTLPGAPFSKGHLHPSQRVIDEVVDFFVGLGYRVAEGPEVETDYYNFTALNIPPGHPARGMQATFFLDEGLVLRTQTSPVQIRTMLSQEPPVYIISPGRVYRRDLDPTHTPMFHQVEGLAVDRGLTLGHLKGTLTAMARHVFGNRVRLRLRPSYFQFTEPSVEQDVSCFVCGGKDPNCKVCKGAGWLEMGGAGMVDPAVLKEVGYDPEEYTGFAFGMGPDRMAMVKYGVPDLRLFFEGDLRFLRQF
jgi:phenylalanyl-tRNA synthetase alpha chain